jgi:hypothetical protein
MDKLRSILSYAVNTAKDLWYGKTTNAALKYIIWYALLLVFSCALYTAGWIFEWYKTGTANLPELRNFLHEIASSPWIAVIGFIAKYFIDKNDNGIPDSLESEEKDTPVQPIQPMRREQNERDEDKKQ